MVFEVALELADVALEARPQREASRHVLGEERGRVRLGAVDRGRPADHDRVHRLGLLTGRQQLKRADHVDVVKLLGFLSRLRRKQDVAVDDGVDVRLRDQLRDERVADVRPDELRAAEVGGRRADVEPGDVGDLGEALEPPRELGAPVAGDARDQDAPAHQRFVDRAVLVADRGLLPPRARRDFPTFASRSSRRFSSRATARWSLRTSSRVATRGIASRRRSPTPAVASARRCPARSTLSLTPRPARAALCSARRTTSSTISWARSLVSPAEPTVEWTVRSTARRTESGIAVFAACPPPRLAGARFRAAAGFVGLFAAGFPGLFLEPPVATEAIRPRRVALPPPRRSSRPRRAA